MFKTVGVLLLLLMTASSCDPSPQPPRIALLWEVLENPNASGEAARTRLRVTNLGPREITGGWRLFFNSTFPLDPTSAGPGFEIERVNGDFWRIERSSAPPLEAGDSVTIDFDILQVLTNDSEAPAGFYFVFEDSSPPVEPAELTIRPLPDRLDYARRRFERDAALQKQARRDLLPLVPSPLRLDRGAGSWRLDENVTIQAPESLLGEASLLKEGLEEILGEPISGGAVSGVGGIRLSLDDLEIDGRAAPAGSYRLRVQPGAPVEITAIDRAGVFYGSRTFLALLQNHAAGPGPVEIEGMRIEDAPRFSYRGLHLDVARNFQTKESVLRLLDLMAFYKLNRFHFHLTDDEGWRFEVAPLPELTQVGSRRGHGEDEGDRLLPSYGSGPRPSGPPGSGYYSRQEMVEILRFARARHIEVIPEIDFPGHARAAIKSMEARAARLRGEGRPEEADATLLSEAEDRSTYLSVQGWNDNVINVCLPSVYRFIEIVIEELAAIYRDAGLELQVLHVGGDEVPEGIWEESPACRRLLEEKPGLELSGYFLGRLGEILEAKGVRLAGWEEVALQHRAGRVEPNPAMIKRRTVAYVWNSVWGWGRENLAYQLANAGFDVVLCNASNLYFDQAYSDDPREPGYHWAGYVSTRSPFEFLPLDLLKSAPRELTPEDWVPLSAAGRRRVQGIQGHVWGENLGKPGRLEYMALPELLALAERAWAREPAWARIEDSGRRREETDQAWEEFANRLGQIELPRLDRWLGRPRYRIPPPGAVVEDGLLRANVEFPGLEIRYAVDGSDPGPESPLYRTPVRIEAPVKLRTFAGDGRSSRIVTAAP